MMHALIILDDVEYNNTQMSNVTGSLINLYLLTTISYFTFLCYQSIRESENYFSAALIILQDPLSKLLLYNFIVAIATLLYRLSIWIFFEEIKENETMVRPP